MSVSDVATLPLLEMGQVDKRAISPWRIIWRRLRKSRIALTGAVVLGIVVLLSVLAPLIAPYGKNEIDLFMITAPPSGDYWLGTDPIGRDVLTRLLYGGQISLLIGVSAAVIAVGVGVFVGAIAGYYGGWVDSLISRAVDLLWAFPVIILAVALVAVRGAGFHNVVIAIAVAYIDDFARIVRGETLSLREEDFTTAARALGASDAEVMFRHIGPNLVAPVTVQLSFAVGLGILAESTLTYLGLGVNPTTPTWGLALNEGRDFVRQAWWISVFPGLAIVITVMALNLLGDGLRDALDVRGVSDV